MRYVSAIPFLIGSLLLLSPLPSHGWNNSCYKGSLPSMAFPKENAAMISLEARRVVSVQGDLMTYDLGSDKVVIKIENKGGLNFLKDVKKGNCSAKTVVTIEYEKKTFAGTGQYKAVAPRPR